MSAARDDRLPWIVFLVALVLRVAFAVEYQHRHPLADRPVIDEAAYEDQALAIAGGDWLGDEVFFQEPLYPYALGALYAVVDRSDDGLHATPRQRTAARHAQAFLGALAVLLVFLVTRRLFGERAALVAGLAAATYRPLLVFPAYLLKANLFVPLLAGLVWLLLRARLPVRPTGRALRPWLAIGSLVGLGALLRGNMLLMAPLFVLWPWSRRLLARGEERGGRALAAGAALALGVALVLVPVALRNLSVGGVFALTTSGAGTNVYGGNNPANPFGRATELGFVRGIPAFEADDWRREAERRIAQREGHAAHLDPGEVSDYWLAETWRSVRAHPGLHLRILWNKLRLALGRYEVPDNHDLAWDARFLFLAGLWIPGFALWGWLGLAGMVGLVLWPRAFPALDRRGALEVLAVFLAYLATIVLTVVSMRVRLALVPLLLPFAGLFAVRAAAAVAGGSRSALAGVAALLALAALPVFVPVVDRAGREEDLAERDFNLATYRLEEPGGLERAARLAQGLGERYPGTPRVENLLAEVAAQRAFALHHAADPGTSERSERLLALRREALGRLRGVVETPGVAARERFRAHAIAAFVQLDAGDEAAAERHLRQALAFDPSDRRLRLMLANALYLQAVDGAATDRSAALAEARELLTGLAREAPSEALDARLAEVRAATGS